MKPQNYRRSVIDTQSSIDSSIDPLVDPITEPPPSYRVARAIPIARFLGGDFRNDTMVGGTTDTVDYSMLREGTSIVANLATRKVDKIFAGAAIGLDGKEGRYIRIYQPFLAVDFNHAYTDFSKLAELSVLTQGGVTLSGEMRTYSYDDLSRTSGGSNALTRAINPYLELDLGSSYGINLIVLRALAGASFTSSQLRVYVSNRPILKSTTAYDTLAADATVARVDVDTTAVTTFTDTLSRIQNLVGTSGRDKLTGDGNANTLSGSGGDDTLTGGAGADSLNGGDGNDVIVQDMSLFDDTLAGGAGVDTVDYSSADRGDFIFANLAAGTVTKFMGNYMFTDTLSGIENVVGTSSSDWIWGDAGANVLRGGEGNDTLSGGAGEDSLLGGDGNDVIVQDMSPFADFLIGGGGNDTADYSEAGTAGSIVAYLATGSVAKRVGGSTFYDTFSSIENVVGTALADNITGDRYANKLSGGAGNDFLIGGEGNDTLVGGAGADNVMGGDGNDLFFQDIGRDSDALAGGTGNDTVDYSLTNLTGFASTGITANLATGKVSKVFAGTSAKVGTAGRYIRIYHTDATQLLTLTGMKVFSGGVDLAAGRPSTVGGDSGRVGGASYNNPWALTDSAVGGAWNGGTQSNTSNVANVTGNKAYIELDLGSLRVIDSIALWGHTNIPANSNNLRVYVSGSAFVSSATAYADLAANAAVARVDLAAVDVTVTSTYTDWLTGIENLLGTALSDSITGDSNANTLSGGAGNDTLAGGTGSDTYLFARGDGADVVQESDTTAGNKDALRFGPSIGVSQIWLRKVNAGKDLQLSIIGSSDSVTVSNWYSGAANHVEEIYAGGKKLLDTNVDKLVSAMAAFSPPAAGQTSLSANMQAALQPMIAANWTAA